MQAGPIGPQGVEAQEEDRVRTGQGIGSGMNIPVIDIDEDGDLDILVTGKYGGPYLFENLSR